MAAVRLTRAPPFIRSGRLACPPFPSAHLIILDFLQVRIILLDEIPLALLDELLHTGQRERDSGNPGCLPDNHSPLLPGDILPPLHTLTQDSRPQSQERITPSVSPHEPYQWAVQGRHPYDQ